MQSGPSWLRAWGATALWALVVWSLGSDGFSAGRTSRVLGPLVAWLLPNLSEAGTELLLFAIRKGAHVFEYAVLTALTLRALRSSAELRALPSAVATLALVAGFALADELRQGLSETRTGSGRDVSIDCAGAVLGLLVVRALPAALRDRQFPTRDRGG